MHKRKTRRMLITTSIRSNNSGIISNNNSIRISCSSTSYSNSAMKHVLRCTKICARVMQLSALPITAIYGLNGSGSIERDANLIGERVELIGGNRVGTVIDTAHAADGNVEALLVHLDNNKVVWIDTQDVRYNRGHGVVMTGLRFDDLGHMADERL